MVLVIPLAQGLVLSPLLVLPPLLPSPPPLSTRPRLYESQHDEVAELHQEGQQASCGIESGTDSDPAELARNRGHLKESCAESAQYENRYAG